MEFNYITHPDMAKLAWGMVISENAAAVDVHVGPYVETRDSFFAAGVWDGSFDKADFENAEFLCGSFAQITHDGHVKVFSSSHEKERICYLKKKSKIYISNSIPCLMALADVELDKKNYVYERILCSIMDGLDDYEREIPLASGEVMYQLFFADMEVTADLQVSAEEKIHHAPFLNYDSYYNSLKSAIVSVVENARESSRVIKYGMLTTVSSGYDSSAAAALARDVGCNNAITFGGEKYKLDSGVEVGRQLGYEQVIEQDASGYKQKNALYDAMSFADGEQGGILEFTVFDDAAKNKLLFVGDNGDHVWGIDTLVNDRLGRDRSFPYFQACISQAEFGLFNGHIPIIVPLYGGSAYPSIHDISVSKEMEPWRLHNSYDRPIPRRIVESHGVERSLFGQEKRGGGLCFAKNFTYSQIQKKMTYKGFEVFTEWVRQKENNPWTFKRVMDCIRYHAGMLPEYLSLVNIKLFGGKIPFHYKEKRQKVVNPGLPSRMIIWGIEYTKKAYQDALK